MLFSESKNNNDKNSKLSPINLSVSTTTILLKIINIIKFDNFYK